MKRLAVLLVVALGLAACGDDGGSSALTADVPDGFLQFAEGSGEQDAGWGSDNQGNTGGFVVLAGSGEGAGLTVVELTGFDGYVDGLADTILSSEAEPTEVDGRAAFTAATPSRGELAVEAGEDVAVVVRSEDLSGDELADIVRATTVPEGDPPTDAPAVDPPAGLTVVGSASADLALALFADADEGYLGGPASASGTAWEGRNGNEALIVLTLPADAGDAQAAFGWPLVTMGQRVTGSGPAEVDGRDAAWLSTASRNILATTTADGDLLLVESISVGADARLLDEAVMIAVAESVTQT